MQLLVMHTRAPTTWSQCTWDYLLHLGSSWRPEITLLAVQIWDSDGPAANHAAARNVKLAKLAPSLRDDPNFPLRSESQRSRGLFQFHARNLIASLFVERNQTRNTCLAVCSRLHPWTCVYLCYRFMKDSGFGRLSARPQSNSFCTASRIIHNRVLIRTAGNGHHPDCFSRCVH